MDVQSDLKLYLVPQGLGQFGVHEEIVAAHTPNEAAALSYGPDIVVSNVLQAKPTEYQVLLKKGDWSTAVTIEESEIKPGVIFWVIE